MLLSRPNGCGLAHATKLPDLLNREHHGYASEEQLVELAANIVTHRLGLAPPIPSQSAAYFQTWRRCCEYRSLQGIGSETNHVGNAILHTHGDNRYHLEGAPDYVSETTLDKFFSAIGVPVSNEQLYEYHNGQLCPNGTPGTIHHSPLRHSPLTATNDYR